jgi:uncharacterized membrane protein YfcA
VKLPAINYSNASNHYRHNYFQYFPDHYAMSVTMIIGAFIGGATSEGGGAVAFPVMTLALALEPRVARDFVYVSQSTGD